MQEISESKLEIAVGGIRDTQCKFMSLTRVSTNTCCRVNIYAVSDLAFYGMVLGRESMMGGWCYLCQLSHKEFQNLMFHGNAWALSTMMEVANEVAQTSFKKHSKLGVKEGPLWPFLPLHHYLPPLLHILIGIWNDCWDKFREWVSELVEYISYEECDLRSRKESLTKRLID